MAESNDRRFSTSGEGSIHLEFVRAVQAQQPIAGFGLIGPVKIDATEKVEFEAKK